MIVDRSSLRSILLIKLRGIGDVILSTVVTKNLRLAFPGAQIDYLTEPPGAEVVRGNPYLNDIVVFNSRRMSGFELIKQVRARSYGMIIDLFCNPRTALVTRLSGAPLRVGFRFRGRSYAYNILAEPRGGTVHNTRFNLDALDAIGVAIQDLNLYFPFTPADDAYVRDFLKVAGLTEGRIAAINPSAGWKTKRWEPDRYAKLADELIERYSVSIVLTWGPGQLEDTRTVQSMIKHRTFVPPETTLKQLGALLKRCSFFVGSDSGPMHLATAVGTPVLGIYGPTNPKLQGPYGEKHLVVRNEALTCLSCNLLECPIGHPCMLDLSVDTVLAHVELLVKRNNLFL